MNSASSIVSVEDVQVKHQGRILFEGPNFSVRPGEHLALVGPGGSGKSALRLCLLARALNKKPPLLILDEPGPHLQHCLTK